MNADAADLLAAIDRRHPLERERLAARMLEHVSTSDILDELTLRYWSDPEVRDACRAIVYLEARTVAKYTLRSRRLRIVRATREDDRGIHL